MRRFSKIRNLAGAGWYLSYSLYDRPVRFLPAVLLPLFTENPRELVFFSESYIQDHV